MINISILQFGPQVKFSNYAPEQKKKKEEDAEEERRRRKRKKKKEERDQIYYLSWRVC